jgi:hypothetical protein
MAETFGSFGSPFVEKSVRDLICQSLAKNFVDGYSYPLTTEINVSVGTIHWYDYGLCQLNIRYLMLRPDVLTW